MSTQMGGQRRVPLCSAFQAPAVRLRRKHLGDLELGLEALAAKVGLSLVSEAWRAESVGKKLGPDYGKPQRPDGVEGVRMKSLESRCWERGVCGWSRESWERCLGEGSSGRLDRTEYTIWVLWAPQLSPSYRGGGGPSSAIILFKW